MSVAQEQSRLLRQGMGELFVNLARRNQSLIERQLALLDELEHSEQDPAALESLFRLDHMATRMRRNAESLLVLSGAEQPRQWHEAIPLLDVVRAAAAEIADFPRVDLSGVDAAVAVSGRAVSDVAHLVAELLENATSFSSPQSPVLVTGAPTANGFVLAISDQGIGIQPERLTEANRLLAHPPVVGLALSRALGLHVVGLLAARHGIGVELRPGAPVGVIALVLLPNSILQSVASRGQPTAPTRSPAAAPPTAVPPAAAPWAADVAPAPAERRPSDEPPVEEWRREGLGEPADAPPDSDAPLRSRVPGQNMSHQPAPASDEPLPESDPSRPQRVHEMLTRHAQGIQRGRLGADDHDDEGLGEQA